MTKISALPEATLLNSTDNFAVDQGSTSKRVTKSTLETELSPWVLHLDLPLTTGTGWSMGTGWTNDGAKMIVGTDATQRRNAYNTRLPLSAFISEVEIQIPSTGRSTTEQRAGVLLNWDGSGTGYPLYMMRYTSLNPAVNGNLYTETDASTAGPTLSMLYALDTWHTFRLARFGSNTDVYLNGTHIATINIGVNLTDGSYLGIYGYKTDAWFRNLKVWIPRLPA